MPFVQSVEPFIRPGTRYVSAFDACDHRMKVLVDLDGKALAARPSSVWTSIVAIPLASPDVLFVGGTVPEALYRPVLP